MRVENIYDRYGDRMYHYLVLKLKSPSDAEGVLQDALSKPYYRAHNLIEDLGNRLDSSPWYYVIIGMIIPNVLAAIAALPLDPFSGTLKLTARIMEKDDDWAWIEIP